MSDTNTLRTIEKLEGFHFSIDRYQRGYRWGMREIYALLDDILAFKSEKEGFYCLQPLVVRLKEDNISYELIDGQQRTTTIYLILKYLLNEDFYRITYETRGGDDGYNQFLSELNTFEFPDFTSEEIENLEDKISEYWKTIFIEEYQIKNSVDNFYLFKAYCLIKTWFENQENIKNNFEHQLLQNTKVIWYEEKIEQSKVANTFINFNEGKISLDQAELIKGLFVLEFKNIIDNTQKSYEENQFADEWNSMEQQLRIPSFWNFVYSEKDNRELANKITLLLELEKGKAKKTEDLFYTLRAYDKAFKSDEKPNWRTLSNLYNLLEEWYQNKETYHLMGAVVHLTSTTIHQVVEEYNKQHSKKALNNYLKSVLRDEFFKAGENNFKDKYNPDGLKYGKREVFRILFLYNIALAQIKDKYYRFPFDLFKKVKLWNIEHIYAKNSKGFENLDDLEKWYKELSEIFEENKEILANNEELKNNWDDIDIKNLEKSNNLVKKIELQLQELLDKDALSNLCLLDNITNIQVSNKVFREKRDKILEINEFLDEKAYIPQGTKEVFQKSITPSQDLVLNYWNTKDRDAYIEDIKSKITDFL